MKREKIVPDKMCNHPQMRYTVVDWKKKNNSNMTTISTAMHTDTPPKIAATLIATLGMLDRSSSLPWQSSGAGDVPLPK